MEKRQEERCSRAEVGDIEDELMSTWIADAATKAAGYRLEQWVGPCPEHLLPHWCAALAGMEDAPLDDIDYNPFTRDLDQQRQAEQSYLARGYRSYSTLALSPDGEAAGMSEIKLHPDRPQIGRQGDTAVLAAHRGHGIGRWMKAANYRLVREAHPELRVIETYNAQSNPWMLDINIAMGYRPHHVFHACQAPIETVLAAVAART
jgi:GNAT superfamily N-acetyltransferase